MTLLRFGNILFVNRKHEVFEGMVSNLESGGSRKEMVRRLSANVKI